MTAAATLRLEQSAAIGQLRYTGDFTFLIRPLPCRAVTVRKPGDDPVRQTNPVLRSIVLITESIFPVNTCLARLRVKPVTAWKGRCDGSDSA
jgi:hypothetical protein